MKKQLMALSILAATALPLSSILGQETATCNTNPTAPAMHCCQDSNGNRLWATTCAESMGYSDTSGCDPQKTSLFMAPGESLKKECRGAVTTSVQPQ
jgi:hypothetical protein